MTHINGTIIKDKFLYHTIVAGIMDACALLVIAIGILWVFLAGLIMCFYFSNIICFILIHTEIRRHWSLFPSNGN